MGRKDVCKPNDSSEEIKSIKKKKLSEDSLLYAAFSSYQQELDYKNDKYERLVKLSRDVTIQSKRAIFNLLRREESEEKLLVDGEKKLEAIKTLLKDISIELKNEDPYLFARAISPGIQEFIEAVTLMYYIKRKNLISYSEVYELYFSFGDDNVLLTYFDYTLGVCDLTGELMRMAINRVGSREFKEAEDICQILRKIYQELSVFVGCHRDISSKLNVMKASINKVEMACYNVKVGGSELPDNMIGDLMFNQESYPDE